MQTPVLTPARRAELKTLAAYVRAWQARTKRDGLRVPPDFDRICFLEQKGESRRRWR